MAATILDTERERAPLLNSFTAFAGLSTGTLGAGALVTFAPAPEQLVLAVLLVLSVVEGAILRFMPETATAKPGVRIVFQLTLKKLQFLYFIGMRSFLVTIT